VTAPDYTDLQLSLTATLQTTPDHLLGKRTAIVNASQVLALLDEREALIRERDELRAKVEAVKAMANEYEGWVDPAITADIRAALTDGGTP